MLLTLVSVALVSGQLTPLVSWQWVREHAVALRRGRGIGSIGRLLLALWNSATSRDE